MIFLRSNTAVIIAVGPFLDKGDGVTIETALTITNERITLVAETDAGSAPSIILDNITGATSATANDLNYISGGDNGMMQLELAAADVNRVGRMKLSITDAANHVPVFHELFVLPAAIYDWLTGVIVPLPANVTTWLGTAASTPTVAGVPNVNAKTWNDLTTVELPLVPTTAGRKLDVSTGGEAGLDWANVGSPTTTVDLSGTTIKTTQKVDVETIKTNPVVNAGTITFPTTATLASTTNITAGTVTTATNVTTVNGLAAGVITAAAIAADAITDAKVASDVTIASVTGAVGSVTGAVGSVTGAVGSVTGAVGSVTGAVGSVGTGGITTASFAAGAINAAAIAADAIGASELAADAVTEIRSLASGTSDSGSTTTMVDAARTEADTDYWVGALIVFTSGTIAGQARTITGFVPGTDTITFSPATTQAVGTQTYEIWPSTESLRPTVAGRTLDVTTTGEAGIDWANVGAPTTTLNLSGTTIKTATDVETDTAVIGALGAGLTAVPWNAAWDAEVQSEAADALNAYDPPTHTELIAEIDAVQTDIAAVKVDTAAILVDTGTTLDARIPAALVSGRMDSSVGAMAANVLTATAIAADAITAAKVADGTIDAATFAAGAINAAAIAADAITDAKVASDVTIASVTGAVGSVTGAVGSVTGNVGGNVVGTVASVVGAVGSVTGNVGGNVTGTIGGLTAGALKDFFDTDSATTYASAVAGSVVKEIADNAGGTGLTVADIADGVWDEALAGHLGAGSTGTALNAAGSAGDPWATTIPGAYGAGSAGKILGDNVNATISSRASQSSLDTLDNLVDTEVAAIQTDVDDIQARLPAALTADGNMKADTLRIGGTLQTAGDVIGDTNDIQARLPAALTADGNIKADTLRVGGTLQTAGDIIGDTNDIQLRLPAALVSGRIDASVGAMAANVLTAAAIAADAITDAKVAADVTIASVTGAVGSVTGSVGSVAGNVVGSVGSVVGAVGSVTGLTAANLDAAISTRATPAQVNTEVDTAIADAALATAAGLATVSGKVDTVDTVVDAIKLKTDNLPSDPADESLIIAATDAIFNRIGADGAGLIAVPWNASWDAEVQSEVQDALDATIADSIPADGTRPSISQALYMLTQFMLERSVASTTVTVKKADGASSLFTLTLDSGTAPTSITRAT